MYYPDGAKLLKKALVNEPMLPLTEWIVNQAEEVSASELYAVSYHTRDLSLTNSSL